MTLFVQCMQAQPAHLRNSFEYMCKFHGAGDWNGITGFQANPPPKSHEYTRESPEPC